MIQELEPSTQLKEKQQIFSKKDEMLHFFKHMGHEPTEIIQEDFWFFNRIGQDNKHMLWHVLKACQSSGQHLNYQESEPVTVDAFVQEILSQITQIHLEVVDRQLNKDYLDDQQTELAQAVKKIESENLENHENAVAVFYVKNKQYLCDIYKFYNIRYKVATIHQSYQPVHAEESDRLSLLALDELDEKLFISIEGRRLDKGDGEVYKEIAQLELPLIEIYQAIRPRYFKHEKIAPCYLILNYSDQSLDAPYRSPVEFEARFDVKLEKSRRMKVISDLLTENQKLVDELEIQIKQRLTLIDQLLEPFQPRNKNDKAVKPMHYVRARGLGEEKDFPPPEKKKEDPYKPKDRDACCSIQ